jgi:DEAD/DEAH box helicase domain-containing protein
MVEVARLLAEACHHRLRCIAFCKSRKMCELVAAYARELLRARNPELVKLLQVGAGTSP